MIIVTGRTFDHRDMLQGMGGWWNNADRRWEFDSLSQGRIDRLRATVGLIVSEDIPLQSPKPSPKPKPSSGISFTSLSQLFGDGKPVHHNTNLYGDDPTYFNYFAPQNPSAFFGFSSLGKLADYINSLPFEYRNDSARNGWGGNGDFSGTANMGFALRMVENGWADGIDLAESILDRLALANPRVKRRKPALAGGSVNIGRMLSGDPAHMIHRPKAPGKKIATFFVEAGCSSSIKPETMSMRAALVAAIVDVMETVGYQCTIVATDTSTRLLERNNVAYQLAVTLKEAGERLNLADTIFALGHPSFLRRMSFATCSSVDETRDIWDYQGSPRNAFDNNHRCAKNEFYIPVIEINSDDPFELLPHVIPKGLPIEIKKG